MKAILWLALFVAGQYPLIAQVNYAAIEGSVVRIGTADRLPKVAIVVRSEAEGPTKEFHTQTDEQGSFRIDKVPAGHYVVFPQSPGYSLPASGVARITAHKGEWIRDIQLSLMRDGVIHGRVLSSDGHPVRAISVELVQASRGGKELKILKPSGLRKETGANGEYRFEVVPGEYYIRTVTTPGSSQVRTYFPNTFEPEDAKPIQLSQGGDISADIHISMTAVFKITGRIIDLLPDREPHYFSGVSLASKSATVREYKLQNANEGMPICCDVISVPDSNVSVNVSNDRFEIDGVRPGLYELTAGIVVGAVKPGELVLIGKGERVPYSRRYGGRNIVEVTNADVADINVEVRHGVDLQGRIVSNGKAIAIRDTDIFLFSADYKPDFVGLAEVDKAGRFIFPNLQEGAYSLDILPLPGDMYVVDIRQGGRKLSGTDLIVSIANPEPLEIVVNPSGGKIDGHVQNGGEASIILMPEDQTPDTPYRRMPIRRTSPSGDFTIRGIPPGKYRIFAFKTLPAELNMGNVPISDFVSTYDKQATTLVVKSGIRTVIGLASIDSSVN